MQSTFKGLFALAAVSFLVVQPVDAHCPKCMKIEAERAKEQEAKGPEPLKYYDEISLTTPQDRSTSTSVSAGSQMQESTLHATPNSTTDQGYQKPAAPYGGSHSDFENNVLRNNNRPSSIEGSNAGRNNAYGADNNIGPGEVREYYFEEEIIPLGPQFGSQSSSTPSYSTVSIILQSPDFIKTLNGPFTLFIPSNDAFRRLPPGTLQDLLRPENQNQLANLVHSHIIAKKLTNDDLTNANATITTVNGKQLRIEKRDGAVTINGARILKSESAGPNGVIYIVDRVLS